MRLTRRMALASGAALGLLGGASAFAQSAPAFTDAQAEAGAGVYAAQCAACHGIEAQGSSIGPALTGAPFLGKWGNAPLGQLFTYTRSSMPPGAGGALPDQAYADVLAFLMRENGAAAGDVALPADPAQLAAMSTPPAPPARSAPFLGIEGLGNANAGPEVEIPDRFANWAPVTDSMLADPPPGDWLSWRRSHSAQGWSPLDQVTTDNVANLQIAWMQALPIGPNMSEPLVHDGVMFVHSYGDEVWALDGATGRVLWRYQRHAGEGAARASKKTMALHGDRLFVATADVHMVALDVRTGLPVWDTPITGARTMRIPGGPIVAEGVVMTGVATQAGGGAIIAGFDAETGEQIWTFNTVAQPGAPGGDTWNGLTAEERSGGSSWTSGSYDPGTGLSYWGAAGTYDTAPLRLRNEGENNDGLYTNATLALDPATGELVWFYQHMPNDQWDLDWVFERTLADIEVGGETRRVVMTAGKPSLFDILDAANGDYLGSVDMGLQNFITAIDPETGAKTYDPALIPAGGNDDIIVCPAGGGGRNWPPTAFNPETRTMFAGARDACMHMVPVEGGGGLLTTGVTLTSIPSARSAEDGMHGIVQALDMESGEIAWEVRQRAPLATGLLVTAGGVAFAGGTDRRFHAWDQADGEKLWSEGLIDGPSGAPISYMVDGRQYVAVVVGHGNPLSSFSITSEFPPAPIGAAAVIVYALPE